MALAMNDPNSGTRDFAIALTDASPDLQHLLRKEPMTVPASRWEAAGASFPARPGSWRVERA